MNHYNCKICNKKHFYYYGLDTPAPESIMEIPEEERGSRVQFFEDKYVLDRKKLFFKGEIEIRIERSNEESMILKYTQTIVANESSKEI